MLFINKLFNSIACLLSFTNLQLVIPGRTWILLYLGRTVYKRLWACLALLWQDWMMSWSLQGSHWTSTKKSTLLHIFFLSFWRTWVLFVWGNWYPYFGLLVTSPLGFKARVGSALFELIRVYVLCYTFPEIHLWCDLLAASMAAKPSLPHTCKALVGLKTRSYHAATHSVRSGRPDASYLNDLNIMYLTQ